MFSLIVTYAALLIKFRDQAGTFGPRKTPRPATTESTMVDNITAWNDTASTNLTQALSEILAYAVL